MKNLYRFTVVLLLFLIIPQKADAQPGNVCLVPLSMKRRLSHNFITCIPQDRESFMGFDTHDSLNQYDGYQFTVYPPDPNNSPFFSKLFSLIKHLKP